MRKSKRKLKGELSAFFLRNGYVRRQDPKRYKAQGYRLYKKGFEIRLMANSRTELRQIRSLLRALGFKPGRPFAKNSRMCQPVYGREALADFLRMVEEDA